MRVSHSFDHTLYFGGTGKSNHRPRFGFLRLPINIVVIVIEIKGLQLGIISCDDCVCSLG
jgi:hypothetical protein